MKDGLEMLAEVHLNKQRKINVPVKVLDELGFEKEAKVEEVLVFAKNKKTGIVELYRGRIEIVQPELKGSYNKA